MEAKKERELLEIPEDRPFTFAHSAPKVHKETFVPDFDEDEVPPLE